MSSDQSTVLMSWAKVSIRMVTEKTYVAEGRVSTIRVRSKIACSVGCPPQLVELSGGRFTLMSMATLATSMTPSLNG